MSFYDTASNTAHAFSLTPSLQMRHQILAFPLQYSLGLPLTLAHTIVTPG